MLAKVTISDAAEVRRRSGEGEGGGKFASILYGNLRAYMQSVVRIGNGFSDQQLEPPDKRNVLNSLTSGKDRK